MTEFGPGRSYINESGSDEKSSGRDRKAFNDLVKMAEELSKNIDKLRRMTISIIFAIIMYCSIIAFAVYIIDVDKIILTSSIVTVIGFASSLYFYSVNRVRINRERRALRSVMNIVHEVFSSVGNDMSPLEQAEINIRLSRLEN